MEMEKSDEIITLEKEISMKKKNKIWKKKTYVKIVFNYCFDKNKRKTKWFPTFLIVFHWRLPMTEISDITFANL